VFIWIMLLSLLVGACHPSVPLATSADPGFVSSRAERPLLSGTLIPVASAYRAQAIASNLAAGSIVSLIDPATNQVQGTGITNTSGSFTVMALATFTPTLNAIYVLEAAKPLGGAGSPSLALRTLVSLTPTGWTSISGSTVTISTTTTAVAVLYRYKGLAASDVLGKVTYDSVTKRSTASALNSAFSDVAVRQVESQVQQALGMNLDPMQAIHPAIDGTLAISVATGSVNMLSNPSFELGGTGIDYWGVGGVNSSLVTATPDVTTSYDMLRSCKITVTGAGDTWVGQGSGNTPAPLTLVGGRTYTLSIWAKGASGGEKIGLRVSGNIPQFLEGAVSGPNFTLTTSWQRYSLTFIAPLTSPNSLVFVRVGSQVGQTSFPETVWIDATQLEVGANASPFAGAPGKLLYDSSTTPASASSTVTYCPGHNGGTGLVLDSGINLVSNGHAQNGTASYGIGGTATLSLTTAYGAPPNCPNTSVFLFTHDSSSNWYYPYQTVNVQPYTNYTYGEWAYFPNGSLNWSIGMINSTFASPVGPVNSGSSATAGTWTKVTGTFNSGSNTTLNILPINSNTPSASVAFTMVQIEQGAVAHPYAGGPGFDRYAIDSRYLNRYAGTIEYWFQPFYDSSDRRFDSPMMGLSNQADQTVLQLAKTGNTLQFAMQDGNTWQGPTWAPSAAMWTANSWHHVAMTWGAPSGMALYFDGLWVGGVPYSGGIYVKNGMDAVGLGNLYLSGSTANANYVQNATIDQFRIFDYPRSPQDIARDYLGVLSLPAM